MHKEGVILARKASTAAKSVAKTSTRMSKKGPLTPDMLRKLDAYWRAANYHAGSSIFWIIPSSASLFARST